MRRAALLLLGPLLASSACASPAAPVTPVPRADAGGPPSAAGAEPGSTTGLLAARRAAGIADCPATDPTAPARADGLPDLTLDCLGADTRVRLAGLRGAPIIVNVWAQWCGPCRQEAPALAALQDRLGGRVRLLGIDHADPRPELAVEFAHQAGHRYAQTVDPGRELAGPLRVVGPPLTLFVDAQGRVVHRHAGPLGSPEQALELARTHLGVAP